MPEKKTNIERNFFDKLRNIIGYYSFYSHALELLFIKYLITFTDQLNIKNIEAYKEISSFKRKNDEAKNGEYVISKDDVSELLDSVDFLKKNSNVRLADIADDLAFFYDKNTQKQILELLDSFVMKNEKENIQYICDYLLAVSINDVSRTGSYVTGKVLRKICTDLLDIKEEDTYMDCFAGYSSSLTEIKDLYNYIGYEVNKEAALISTITCIMMGLNHFEINNADYLFETTDGRANKVLSDVIFGYKREYPDLAKKYGVNTKDVDVLSFYKSYYSASESGSVVLAVPGKFLFSSAKAYVELRERITKGGLRAVISLPALWQGTSIGTNLIYIDKAYHGEIEFVDASKESFGEKKNYYETANFEMLNTSNIKWAIKELWKSEGEYNSEKVEEVLAKGTWLPERYVNTEKKNTYRSISEIDDELSSLYEQLKENM